MTHRILIVDDQDDWRMLFRAALDRYAPDAFEVVGEAAGPAAGLELARTLAPDLIVLDLSMPHQDGLETIGPLTQAAPDSCIVIVSAWPEEEAGAPARALGAVDYLEKGRPISELVTRLAQVAD